MLIEDFKIYGVIEISPWRFPKGPEIMDKLSTEELSDDELFETAVLEVYQTHGINNIERLNSYHQRSTKISKITPSDLSGFVEAELFDAEISNNGTDLVDAFEGGLFIEFDGNAITHSCCGKISNYKNWEKFLTTKPTDWSEVWIGHPWVYGKINNGRLSLSDYFDETMQIPKDDSFIKYEFDLADFESKFNNAVLEIHDFKDSIKKYLESIKSPYAEIISNLLLENE